MIDEKILKDGLGKTLNDPLLKGYGEPQKGKVRNSYIKDGVRYIVTSDRISAFDRILGTIPFKGQVLNYMAAFWFNETKDIVPNHLISTPDPAVMKVMDCEPMPVEMVVRAYITGSTSTSIWTHYQNGSRNFCGNALPEGLKKHQKLEKPILTPSTKAEQGDHDVSVSKEELLAMGRISEEDFDTMAKMSLDLFNAGSELCRKNGLILVDTKYEFGRTKEGQIVVIDEIHTPDSSRFWQADTYDQNFSEGNDPKGLDKEYVRTWLKNERNFTGDGDIPQIPDEIKIEAARRYIETAKQVTGQDFIPNQEEPNSRLEKNMAI
ncbi:MAG: phosphoribosylaminoimidazolesuccinocarboxamide synthase [Deltaproteobacteria bacterium]|nr:phosphoribosylaminoimidazolesuccinocarboxamide synthase [Deltaproteobacteria bacterium]